MVKNKLRIIAILCVLVCVGLSVLFLNDAQTYVFKNGGKYFINDREFEIENGMKAVLDDDNESIYFEISNDNHLSASAIPAYTSNNSFVIMNKLSIYIPGINSRFIKKKINSFVEAEYNSSLKTVYFSNGKNENKEQYGFLYDGHSTFVFLEEMTLVYNGNEHKISPMTFATVSYNNWIEYYDPNVGYLIYEQIRGDVTVESKIQDYRINIANHTVNYEGRDTILITNINMMEDYFLD